MPSGTGRLAEHPGQVSEPDVDMRPVVGGVEFFGDRQGASQWAFGSPRVPRSDQRPTEGREGGRTVVSLANGLELPLGCAEVLDCLVVTAR